MSASGKLPSRSSEKESLRDPSMASSLSSGRPAAALTRQLEGHTEKIAAPVYRSVRKVSDHTSAHSAQPPPGESSVPVHTVPLKVVVAEAVKRWFDDTYQEAQRGDVKQQALLGQMYAEGYGCEKDTRAAREWIERARERGYCMRGVYCEL